MLHPVYTYRCEVSLWLGYAFFNYNTLTEIFKRCDRDEYLNTHFQTNFEYLNYIFYTVFVQKKFFLIITKLAYEN